MAAGPSIDVSGWLKEQLAQASPDLLRSMVQTFAATLMGAEADAVCGTGYGKRSPERSNPRNGYRLREWDTRAGCGTWASAGPGWSPSRPRRCSRCGTCWSAPGPRSWTPPASRLSPRPGMRR